MFIKNESTKTKSLFQFAKVLVAIQLLWFGSPAWSEIVLEVDGFSIDVLTEEPSTADSIVLSLTSDSGCAPHYFYETLVNNDRTIDILLNVHSNDFLCPPGPTVTHALPRLPIPGPYTFNIYRERDLFELPPNPFNLGPLQGSFEVVVTASPAPQFWAETPQHGSIQSGIGLIRGWSCDATSVEVSFDDEPRITLAYGTVRADTEAICGDTDNGYGAVFAWGLLGHGTHRMKTFINNIEVADVEFEVAGLDMPFVRGLSASYLLEGFPGPGESVLVEWSEADQNFIIVEKSP